MQIESCAINYSLVAMHKIFIFTGTLFCGGAKSCLPDGEVQR